MRTSADGSIEGLKADGIAVRGQVGDADPLTALEDALSVFEADAVVIATLPPGESHWQEKGLLGTPTRGCPSPCTTS